MSLNATTKIKKNFDWDEYITVNYMYKTANGRRGKELRVCCPNCDDTKFKCYINPDLGLFNCYKCDFHTGNYDVFDFVALTEGLTRGQALMQLLLKFKPTAPTEDDFYAKLAEPPPPLTEDERPAPQSLPEPAKLVEVGNSPHWAYLAGRGFTERDLRVVRPYYIPQKNYAYFNKQGKYVGDLGNRIIFPVYYEGELVSWQARSLDNSHPKYLSCAGSDLSKTVWPYAKPYTDTAVLVEGLIDALAARRVEGVSAYATFGKRVSKEQLKILQAWGVKNLIVWYDKKDALQEMKRTVETAKMYFSNVEVPSLEDWPKDKDVGYFLSVTNSAAIIEGALSKRINTYNPLEYAQWAETMS